jgi:hypothetical protein
LNSGSKLERMEEAGRENGDQPVESHAKVGENVYAGIYAWTSITTLIPVRRERGASAKVGLGLFDRALAQFEHTDIFEGLGVLRIDRDGHLVRLAARTCD